MSEFGFVGSADVLVGMMQKPKADETSALPENGSK